jgi:omega-amidase
MKITAAAIQYDVTKGAIDYNMRRAEELISAAVHEGAQLLLLPEMWNCGFDFENLSSHAQDFSGEAVTMLRQLARDNSVFIVGGSFAEKKNGKYYNTCPVINEQGEVIARYRKVHLFSHYLKEHLYFKSGEEWVLTDYQKDDESVRLGHIICYDLRFPEFARNLALRGARIFTVPSGWPRARITEYEIFCRARAAENRSFLISANYSRSQGGVYCGNSLIVSPFGQIIAKLDNDEGYAMAKIDLSVLNDPDTFNSIADRRQFLDEIDDNQL